VHSENLGSTNPCAEEVSHAKIRARRLRRLTRARGEWIPNHHNPNPPIDIGRGMTSFARRLLTESVSCALVRARLTTPGTVRPIRRCLPYRASPPPGTAPPIGRCLPYRASPPPGTLDQVGLCLRLWSDHRVDPGPTPAIPGAILPKRSPRSGAPRTALPSSSDP
jgi:hypothetical protein